MRASRLVAAFVTVLGTACTYGVVGSLPVSEDAVTRDGGDAAADGGADAIDAASADATTDASTCSRGGRDNVTARFVNTSTTATYEKLWIDYRCAERSYGTIGPNQTQNQGSFSGHVWSLRDTSTGAIVKTVRLGQSSPETINIP